MREHINELSRRAFLSGTAVLGVASLAVAPQQAAFAVTSAEKQAEADAVRNQLIGLQADLEVAAENYYAAIDEQEAAQAAMRDEQVKIDDSNAQIASLQGKLSDRARSMYRTGSSSFLDFILGATSFEELTTNWDLLNRMNQNDTDMVDQTKILREELQAAKDEYARQEQIAADKAAEAKAIEEEVQVKVDEASTLVAQLDEEARVLLEQEQAAAAAAAAAEAERQRQEALAAEAAQAQNDGDDSDGGFSSSYSSGSGSSIPSYGSVVDYALSRIGCPYVWGGSGPNTFDCSGLVAWSYAQVGMYLPHQSTALYNCATWRGPVSEARPGDVLWRYGHVGIAVGYGGVPYVHAPTFGAYVRDTDSLSWASFTHALRFG